MAERLTDRMVKGLAPPKAGNELIFDDVGSRSRYQNDGRRRESLCAQLQTPQRRSAAPLHHRAVSRLDGCGAREEAKRLKRVIDGGGDPVGEHRAEREAPTVNDLVRPVRGRATAESGALDAGRLPIDAARPCPARARQAQGRHARVLRRRRAAPDDHQAERPVSREPRHRACASSVRSRCNGIGAPTIRARGSSATTRPSASVISPALSSNGFRRH